MPTDLEHLNEGHTKIQICQVAADQAQAEEQSNGNDSAQVHTTSHLDSLAPVKEVSVPREELGHNCCKGQVVRCQDDGVVCLVLVPGLSSSAGILGILTKLQRVQNPFVEQNDRGAHTDPGAE